MTIETIKDKVIEILENMCTESVCDTSATLLGDLSLDSLNMVMLLVMIEDTFEIELDESDMNPFDLVTVEDIITLVAKYRSESDGDKNG